MKDARQSTHTKMLQLFLPISLALLVVVGALALGNADSLSQQKNDAIFSRQVVSYERVPSGEAEEMVKYGYQGEKVPEKITPDEVVEKRTENSYTREVEVINKGTKDEKIIYESVFYSQPTFSKEGNDWYYIEHATTTESAFNAFRKENALATLFIPKAHADSITPFSGAGDGFVRYTGGTDFTECTTGGTGLSPDSTGTTAVTAATDNEIILGEDAVYTCNIRRTFLPFDTSAMPAGASVSATTLHVYVTTKVNELDDGIDYISVVETSQATHTTIAASDFGNSGSTQGATAIDIGSITTSAYNVFTFNSTGRSNFINGSGVDAPCSATNGISCIGFREGHDLNNIPMNSVGDSNSMTISTSEATGTSQDPYLTVTYSAGQPVLWQMWEF
jgi:hypothetical protein